MAEKKLNKICSVCKEKGTTHYRVEFFTCNKHREKDVYKKWVDEEL